MKVQLTARAEGGELVPCYMKQIGKNLRSIPFQLHADAVILTRTFREGAYRSGFNHKYPRAYDSYKGRLDHEHHAYMQGQFAPRQAEHHVIERDNALVQEITPGRRRR